MSSRRQSLPLQSEFYKNQIGERAMLDNTNPYALRMEISRSITRYYTFLSRTGKAQIVKQMRPAPPTWVPALYQGRAQLAALEQTPY